jgi:cytochrome b6-f complex iron-sulfur subunit
VAGDERTPREGTEDPARRAVPRRRALELLLGGSSLGVAAALGFPVARFLAPLESDAGSRSVELDPDDLPPFEGRLVVVAGLPALVVNTGEGYAAFSAVCTHLGCVVKWKRARRQFFCPCHGGRFDLAGRVLGGPAPRPLARLVVEEREGRIVVRA